ncbi:MAG: hypothetical protein LC734_05440, partial [Acidobacteria bacterium]|nr:hypothetical protein [Acidobacteriota bacterium]
REQCRRQLARSVDERIKYGFFRHYKPVLDDARFRSFEKMEDYRKWADENLPRYLGISWCDVRTMESEPRGYFQPQQAREVASAFGRFGVEYMFIGKSGAILLGYPSATQDVHLFAKKSEANGRRIISVLIEIGFEIDGEIKASIIRGKDFVQLKSGPFDLDIIFAPDGIESFDRARERMIIVDNFPVANIRDIIASKKASGREKDKLDLPLLEDFRIEFEKNLRKQPRTALEIALEKLNKTKDE